MTALEIQAIKALPDDYVVNGTCFALAVIDRFEIVLAVSPGKPPLWFNKIGWHVSAVDCAYFCEMMKNIHEH